MSNLKTTGKPAQQLMSLLWAEDKAPDMAGKIFLSTRRLITLKYVWVNEGTLTVRLTPEGRKVARQLAATTEGMAYMLEMEGYV